MEHVSLRNKLFLIYSNEQLPDQAALLVRSKLSRIRRVCLNDR